ncbi:MAG: AMP-binding protein [Gammaproteobacteria bacterium]|nr:AMP-binding protein [Gammaproteobacteria bacterium]
MSAVTASPLLSLLAGADAAPALGAPGREALSHGALRTHLSHIGEELARAGIGADDRVAIVLPNGPAMASCFVAVAAATTAAPLNPAYRDAEFQFYLDDLAPKAMILAAGDQGPARDVAQRAGIRIIELEEDPATSAGLFTLDIGASAARGAARTPGVDDIALVLHTSGTTSRPKIVPLSQGNLMASARNIPRTLALSAADHCLNIMPLFHIHGLIAAVLSSLASGGQVTCTPGFSATAFFGWLDAARPSWYTAVPTMHQVILDRAERNRDIIARAPLRFIRSSSSSLPPPVMTRLEEVFACPVLEAYGMTEAAHQMTSNPLPPAPRKAGAVGLPAGPEVRTLHADGRFSAAGEEGEIVIRGPNVTRGYANNEAANASAFAPDPDGGAAWFRTGDLGVIDGNGYLAISGRIKEIINRGGEKIAPREVDDVLTAHPDVKQAVTFALSHPKLGEDVAAAVVMREGAALTERALRDYAASQLAPFKVPARVVFVDEIPKGSTGKLTRIGLAKLLGLE